jgi:hypothetical protein
MKYQLVIQFVAKNIEALDDLILLEEKLITKLAHREESFVDGHDFGMGELNIFIHTNEPLTLLEEAAEVIEGTHPGIPFAAGYRSFDDDTYVVLWPPGLESFRVA